MANITLETLLQNPGKWKSVSKTDIMTTYLSEALDSKETAKLYIAALNRYAPWAITAIALGVPMSVYALKEFFKNEIGCLASEPRYEYGSQTVFQLFRDLMESYTNKTIMNEKQRKKFIFKAADVLSIDEYRVFSMVIKQELDHRLYDMLAELHADGIRLPDSIINSMLFTIDRKTLHSAPEDCFQNPTISCWGIIPKGKLSYHLCYGHIEIEVTTRLEKKPDAFNPKEISWLAKVPYIIIRDESGPLAVMESSGTFLHPSRKNEVMQITEHVFSMKVCQGLESMLILDMAKPEKPRISGVLSFDAGTMIRETKVASSWSTSVIPYYNYTCSLITCIEKDTENTFYVFALTDRAQKMGKTTKNFKVVTVLGKHHLI